MEKQVDHALRSKFLEGMSHAACTVNIVTTDGPAGRAGVTVSAMASVSADSERPTLLVCVHELSPAAPRIVGNGVLCVNVLRDDQSYVSDTFAGRFKDEIGDKFECTDWVQTASGAPCMADPLVAFECRLLSHKQVGTHHIFLCEVMNLTVAQTGSPLIYANRAYGRSSRIDGIKSLRNALLEGAAQLSVGCFHTFGPYVMPGIIKSLTATELRLAEGDHRSLCEELRAGAVELAMMYDIGLPEEFQTIELDELHPYVLLPDNHPLAQQNEIAPEELAEEPMVLLDAAPSDAYFTGIMRDAGVTPLIAHRSASLEMVRGLVGHGLGYALLATKPASEMTYDGLRLVARQLSGRHRPARIVLVYRKGQELSAAARRFIRLCRKAFEKQRAA
ncbi:LysR substrate-binding domain-containing protein [Leisingera sp.]|uniref:LysR substrate-binding domain-containing protein n=1 Tax=Leisingera sp. TaxID=1879318 RepID=UPI002B27A37A|nr:LysR substrate-binding domain-containing protein [Leisingera sp.]